MRFHSRILIPVFLFFVLIFLNVPQVISINPLEPNYATEQDIINMIYQIDEETVFDYLSGLTSYGPRFTNSINCVLAGDYIFREFQKMGIYTEYHEWNVGNYQSRNIVATLPGSDPLSSVEILFTAHYDTVKDAPGANDDGSGIAAIMAAAKVMQQYSFRHTIRFIAFSGEEVGTYGSFSYARDAHRRGDNIYAVINPDIIGYANTASGGRIIRFMCPERSLWITEFAQNVSIKYRSYVDMMVESRPNYIGADHQPFIDYGYDGVWIAHHDNYQWGHTPNDVVENLNRTYEVKATQFLTALVADLAITTLEVQVCLLSPIEGYGYILDRPVVPLDLPKKWYMGLRGLTLILGRAQAKAEAYSTHDIEYVVFCLDGNFMYWDSQPPYEWRIEGKHYPPMGRHILSVYAYTTDGYLAYDEMEITIFTFACQYG
ncbi:MAG: Zn-dependent exopeptidase M28 [Candidatus Thermoplasmatota archaeon]|nr:Zn-dependent exopeptidase M28 [Candidatus Thermoplasmatota archaeon]MBU1940479.1 Zn-dependent exopeptidase M28 [Candidatus Thermoplasmatota archaeon]